MCFTIKNYLFYMDALVVTGNFSLPEYRRIVIMAKTALLVIVLLLAWTGMCIVF